jgi:hypothetical protein
MSSGSGKNFCEAAREKRVEEVTPVPYPSPVAPQKPQKTGSGPPLLSGKGQTGTGNSGFGKNASPWTLSGLAVNPSIAKLGRRSRKPSSLLRLDGVSLFRYAERTFWPLLFQLPPRFTRFEPEDAPMQHSITGIAGTRKGSDQHSMLRHEIGACGSVGGY